MLIPQTELQDSATKPVHDCSWKTFLQIGPLSGFLYGIAIGLAVLITGYEQRTAGKHS